MGFPFCNGFCCLLIDHDSRATHAEKQEKTPETSVPVRPRVTVIQAMPEQTRSQRRGGSVRRRN
jgi:hypothetical protein